MMFVSPAPCICSTMPWLENRASCSAKDPGDLNTYLQPEEEVGGGVWHRKWGAGVTSVVKLIDGLQKQGTYSSANAEAGKHRLYHVRVRHVVCLHKPNQLVDVVHVPLAVRVPGAP